MTVAVVLGALGDVMLSEGMKSAGGSVSTTLRSPLVLGSFALHLAFLLLYMASLSWEDLTFVLPLTAADYVLVTLFAVVLVAEPVSLLRWAGTVLVSVGVVLVARS